MGVYIGDNKISDIANPVDSYFEFSLALIEGKNLLKFEAIRGEETLISDEYVVSLDQTSPEVDLDRSKLFVMESNDNKQKIVRAEVYLDEDTESASVSFGNYTIELIKDEEDLSKWIGNVMIFNQEEKQLFNPVVMPTLIAYDLAGNITTVDISWDNAIPVKASLMEQYLFAKNNQSGISKTMFLFTSTIYKIILGLIVFTLLINVFVQLKKQNPKIILSSLAIVILLIILIIL